MSEPLHVLILREPFSYFFELHLDNGQTEELEPDDCRAWFKERGADMDKIEKVLDHVWNFQRAEVFIKNPKEPGLKDRLPYYPNI